MLNWKVQTSDLSISDLEIKVQSNATIENRLRDIKEGQNERRSNGASKKFETQNGQDDDDW